MRLNPTPTEYSIRHTELYEASHDRLARLYPGVEAAFEILEEDLRARPFSFGPRLPVFPDRNLYVAYTTSKVVRIPGLRALFEVDGRRITCWCVSERQTPIGQPQATIHTLMPKPAATS